jgi:protein TonB
MTHALMANLLAWSLQILALVVVAGALPWILRIHEPAVRHGYWRALLLACVLLPILQPWQPMPHADALSFGPLPIATTSATGPSSVPAGVDATRAAWPEAWADTIIDAAAVVLVGGILLRGLWLATGLVHLRRLRRAGTPARAEQADDDLRAFTAAGAEVRFVRGIGQPVTFGLFRPVVLLPHSMPSHPPAVRRAVTVHELWHVQRRDWLFVVLEECVRAVFWFHPAMAWLITRVQASREEVVDELTVLATNGRRSYVEALLSFADEPSIYPAAPFARRRHLFQRMLLISREDVMSSRRIVASCAVMGAVVLMGGWYGVAAFPLTAMTPLAVVAPQAGQMPPRDLRPGEPRPASARERELVEELKSGTGLTAAYTELATLQEQRGAVKEAEQTLVSGRAALPSNTEILAALARFYSRTNRPADMEATLGELAALDPSDPQRQHLVATFYFEKASRDASLPTGERQRYIQAGIAAEDRALALNPQHAESLAFKSMLLRLQASTEADPARRTQLAADADQLRAQAVALQSQNQAGRTSTRGAIPPPPPPPPPPPGTRGRAVRIGGDVRPPTKILNVAPIYPEDARAARIAGVVIIEATIDEGGYVADAKVLRSVPPLDDAALDAVRQWQFTPTLLNGQPVPVMMTLTVNFSLQQQ